MSRRVYFCTCVGVVLLSVTLTGNVAYATATDPWAVFGISSPIAPLGSASAPSASSSTSPSVPYGGPASNQTPVESASVTQPAANTVSYSSVTSNEAWAVFGIGPSVAPAASAGPIQTYATNTNASSVTNSYQVNTSSFSSAWAAFGITAPAASTAPAPLFVPNTAPSFDLLTPEPTTWMMVGTALAGLGWIRRRRKA